MVPEEEADPKTKWSNVSLKEVVDAIISGQFNGSVRIISDACYSG